MVPSYSYSITGPKNPILTRQRVLFEFRASTLGHRAPIVSIRVSIRVPRRVSVRVSISVSTRVPTRGPQRVPIRISIRRTPLRYSVFCARFSSLALL